MEQIKYEGKRRTFAATAEYEGLILNETRIMILLGLCKSISGKRVIDLGCGPGVVGKAIMERYDKEVYGIDCDKECVEIANERGIKCILGNAERGLPFKNDAFDAAICGEMIEHIYNTDFFLEEIKRVLIPNGILILTTPNIASLEDRLALLIGRHPPNLMFTQGKIGNKGAITDHIRGFTYSSLKSKLQKHNFAVIEFKSSVMKLKGFVSRKLAEKFPSLGQSLIIKAKCEK